MRGRGAASERRVLDEAGGFGAMTWVMAIMLFLTVLAGALALGTAAAARLLDRELAGRLTVQVAGGEVAGARVLAALRGVPGIGVAPVDRGELARLLRPWLGSDGADPELPVPQLIDVTLNAAAADRIADIVHAADPAASVELHAGWMGAVGGLLRTLTWLGAGLVLLMASATAAVVVLAARAGLETHRATIEVMHMMGATDVQVARLFQRRVAIDAAIGGTVGAAAALAVTAAIGGRLAGLGSQLIGGLSLGTGDWLLLAALPLGFVVLATLAARTAVLATLRRLVGLAAIAWCLGFAAFMLALPRPLEGTTTDAIVVPTGGAGRIDRGLDLLRRRQAKRLLVTGVGPGVGAADLARENRASSALFACCVDLGSDAVDTRSNAEETAAWVRLHHYTTVRLVSSDWHARRARMELGAVLGPRVTVLVDGVPSSPRLMMLVSEYNKLILRRVALWTGFGK